MEIIYALLINLVIFVIVFTFSIWYITKDPGWFEPKFSIDDLNRKDTDARVCPHCGAENEESYTYCSNCASKVPT